MGRVRHETLTVHDLEAHRVDSRLLESMGDGLRQAPVRVPDPISVKVPAHEDSRVGPVWIRGCRCIEHEEARGISRCRQHRERSREGQGKRIEGTRCGVSILAGNRYGVRRITDAVRVGTDVLKTSTAVIPATIVGPIVSLAWIPRVPGLAIPPTYLHTVQREGVVTDDDAAGGDQAQAVEAAPQ